MNGARKAIAAAGALALLAASTGASAGSSELEELKAQLEILKAKVEALERRERAERGAQSDAPASGASSPGALAQARAGKDAAGRFDWKGDLRYRHENIDPEAAADQTRHRIRARFGFTAKINETVSGTVRLATGGGTDDPRSTNQTLGDGFDRKDIALDQAYLEWRPAAGLNLLAGKMPQPWKRAGGHVWDPDITPEGLAVKLERGPFFGSAFGYWLSESGAGTDATLSGAQLGMTGTVGIAKLMGAIGYFDAGAVRGRQTAQPAGCASGFDGAFFGGAQGNTTVSVGGCPFLVNDYDMIEALAQAELAVGSRPLVVFADFIRNRAVDDLDTGFSAGFTLGRARDPGSWELGYAWQSMEKDAQFGQFVDSDFGGGITDVEGSTFRFGFAPAEGWVVNGTYFMNERFVDVGTKRDYDRYQLDVSYRF